MNPQFTGRGSPVPVMTSKGGGDGLGFHGVGGSPVMRGRCRCRCCCRSVARRQFLRQMGWFDSVAVAQHDGMFQGVFQFPDVARIIVGHEKRHGFRRDFLNGGFSGLIKSGQKMIDQKGNVFPPASKGRQFDAEDMDSVKEILPECAFFHAFR